MDCRDRRIQRFEAPPAPRRRSSRGVLSALLQCCRQQGVAMSLIPRMFQTVFLSMVMLIAANSPSTALQECKWFGTKPFCDGKCPSGWNYTGKREGCTTGSRRYCCREVASAPIPGPVPQTCRWFGTRPFCNGQCPSGWTYSGRRESCTTGSRRFCCYSGTVPPPVAPGGSSGPATPPPPARYCTNDCNSCTRDRLRCRQRSLYDTVCPSSQSFFLAPQACY